MRIIVCGSRNWNDDKAILKELTFLVQRERTTNPKVQITVIHGAARGADLIAGAVAQRLGLQVEAFPADWEKHGQKAGFVRNTNMLRSGADLVMAFKDGFDYSLAQGGTEHMVKIAKAAGVKCFVYDRAQKTAAVR
jgi:hypothetical protein